MNVKVGISFVSSVNNSNAGFSVQDTVCAVKTVSEAIEVMLGEHHALGNGRLEITAETMRFDEMRATPPIECLPMMNPEGGE